MASLRVRVVITALEQHVAKIMVAVALQILARLVASPAQGGTPVDTGWARANWVPSIGEPVNDTNGSPEQVSVQAQAAGQASLLRYKVSDGQLHITNNVPYILPLNNGWSKQAPKMFIQTAIKAGVAKVFNR